MGADAAEFVEEVALTEAVDVVEVVEILVEDVVADLVDEEAWDVGVVAVIGAAALRPAELGGRVDLAVPTEPTERDERGWPSELGGSAAPAASVELF